MIGASWRFLDDRSAKWAMITNFRWQQGDNMARRRRAPSIPEQKWPQMRVTIDEGKRLFDIHVIDSAREDAELDHLTYKLQEEDRKRNIRTIPGSAGMGIDALKDYWTKAGYEFLPGLAQGATGSKKSK